MYTQNPVSYTYIYRYVILHANLIDIMHVTTFINDSVLYEENSAQNIPIHMKKNATAFQFYIVDLFPFLDMIHKFF